jgi:hypothetical protein
VSALWQMTMTYKPGMRLRTCKVLSAGMTAGLLCAVAVLSFGAGPGNQKTFATAEQAADALVAAAETNDVGEITAILGPGSEDLVVTKDSVADKSRTAEFVQLAHEKLSVIPDPKDPKRAQVVIGEDDWPLPIPLVQRAGKWQYDTKSGREQILLRRIGENELDAIQVCRGYVEAQHEYASEKHDGSELNQYAQHIISTPGKHDGLAWQNPDGTWGGPVGERVAEALQEGYKKGQPYNGYYFKILKEQGPAAPLGAMTFVVKGAMIGGFALAAAPAQYGVTGIKTMESYNPDKTWRITDDEL